MQRSTINRQSSRTLSKSPELPDIFLPCYEIVNKDDLRWNVRSYKVLNINGRQSHADRGDAKQVIWSLRKQHSSLCRGYGFVVDVDAETVIVPSTWQLRARVQE